MKHLCLFSFLLFFICLLQSSLSAQSPARNAADPGLLRLGNGIAAIAEGQIITIEELRRELVQWVRKDIGPIASPDLIQWAPGLPKTRSGKIMRRILRKVAENEHGALGDTSTLADPSVVDNIVENRQNR